ncbi:methylaspartate ammonia-lyase [Erythrobacter sp. W53]|uniref:methylaspartate ammonia-lyase n=1 Tax=Erythrobacter sp. W53 TaxID=3425947 RepID=UPI003D766B9D
MTEIVDIILSEANGSFFYDDQAAIRSGLEQDGFTYAGNPQTPGFTKVRIPSAALSIGLVLSDGAVIWGDMVSVQYSGAAGRDPLFDRDTIATVCRERAMPKLIGSECVNAAENCAKAFANNSNEHVPLAIQYGASQALIAAAAYAKRCTMTEIICEIFDESLPTKPIPIFSQSGDERKLNVDKMVLKKVDVLPHGLINSKEKFGPQGEIFLDYIRWVAGRVRKLGAPDYQPVLHFDLYGWIGLGYSRDPIEVARFMAKCADAATGFELLIESPVDYGERAAQIDNYAALVAELDALGTPAKVVADEHCNTLQDVRDFCDAKAAHVVQIKTPDVGSLLDTARAIGYAKKSGVGAYSGGTSAETDLSARACVHVALAMQATMMLAKPGMGVDEGICIVGNEQNRTLAQIRRRLATERVQ